MFARKTCFLVFLTQKLLLRLPAFSHFFMLFIRLFAVFSKAQEILECENK